MTMELNDPQYLATFYSGTSAIFNSETTILRKNLGSKEEEMSGLWRPEIIYSNSSTPLVIHPLLYSINKH